MSLLGRTFQKINSFSGGHIARMIANKLIHDYGELKELIIDKNDKTVTGKVLLRGEISPISFNFIYDVIMDGGKYFILIKKAKLEREWMHSLAQKFLIDRKIEIPADKFKLIADLLV